MRADFNYLIYFVYGMSALLLVQISGVFLALCIAALVRGRRKGCYCEIITTEAEITGPPAVAGRGKKVTSVIKHTEKARGHRRMNESNVVRNGRSIERIDETDNMKQKL